MTTSTTDIDKLPTPDDAGTPEAFGGPDAKGKKPANSAAPNPGKSGSKPGRGMEPDFVDKTSAWEQTKRLLKPIASLKLTVVLFCLALFLIFAGTWAQRNSGIWAIMSEYFRTWIAWVDIAIFLPDDSDVSFVFPFPGGFIVGGLMMINLIAAHVVRFRMTWKRSGIIATHAGIILLLIGELITAIAATEGQIQIEQGRASNYAVNIERAELAIIDPTDPSGDKVIAIPEEMLIDGQTIDDPNVPLKIKVLAFYPNSMVIQRWPNTEIAGRNGNVMRGLGALMQDHANDPDPAVQAAILQGRKLFMMQNEAQSAASSNRWPQPMSDADLAAMVDFFSTARINRGLAGFNRCLQLFNIGDASLAVPPVKVGSSLGENASTYTYVPDRDTDEWRDHGKSWLIWNAWGGDAAMLWIDDLQETVPNLAPDSMIGTPYLVKALAPGSGIEVDMSADVASAYLEITNPNPTRPELAVTKHLVTCHFGGSHAINTVKNASVDDTKPSTAGLITEKTWLTALRFQREYKPYTVKLIEFRHDKYTGSSKAKNFSSKVNIYGPDGELENELPIVISMNAPLRYKGETFFQSSFLREAGNDAAGTVLQVVRNPGWLLPYIACIIVSLGLLIHFGYMLDRYIRKIVKSNGNDERKSAA